MSKRTPLSDGSFEHDGSPCPVKPETFVIVRTRNGQIFYLEAQRLDWSHRDGGNHRDDIVAFWFDTTLSAEEVAQLWNDTP